VPAPAELRAKSLAELTRPGMNTCSNSATAEMKKQTQSTKNGLLLLGIATKKKKTGIRKMKLAIGSSGPL